MKGARRKVTNKQGSRQGRTPPRQDCLIPPCSPRQGQALEQEAELKKLQQRVNSVGARFSGTADENRRRNRRLAGLIGAVEEGLAHSQRQVSELRQDLGRANEKIQHLEAMLYELLSLTENAGAPSEAKALQDLEARIGRLADEAVAQPEAEDSVGPGEPGAPAGSAERAPDAGAASPAEARAQLSAPSIKAKASERTAGQSAEDAAKGPRAPLGLSDAAEAAMKKGSNAASGGRRDHAGVPDLNKVQDIFKRVSMMTGRVRDGRG